MARDRRSRILVVDDEEYICKLIVESLGPANYDIVTFHEAARAIEHLAANPVDLVLTDLMMGRSSGIKVLEAALENHPDAIVVLMTAHPTVETAIAVLKRGAHDFLVKPFKLEMLNQVVERGLAHQKIFRDNLSLKGQVEFLRVANAFFGSGMEFGQYLELLLKSCNTELSAAASAILEIDPRSREIVRRVAAAGDPGDEPAVLDTRLLDQFSGSRNANPVVSSEPVMVENNCRYRILISQPIMVRRTLHGVINALILSRQESVPSGRLDALALLASSAASAIANQKLYEDLQQSYFQAIRALTNAIEARDHCTAGHTDRVTRLAEQVALRLGWTEKQLHNLRIGCTLHDIGKIGVPDAILNKTGILTDAERKRMMKHPEVGLKIIRGIELFRPSIPYIIAHHERYDGHGYPRGLQGGEIPIEGRLLSVVDTFDAVMSDRPYRVGASLRKAVGELTRHAGTQFDPDLVRVFLDVLRSGSVDLKEMYGRKEDLSCLETIGATEKARA
ncbi:MAG: HD domain-containing phosphohydrolase [Candidatus Zixiibacteriota bacterium]